MEIAFETKELRRICANEYKAQKKFGDKVAYNLKKRLADFRAAESPTALLCGNPRTSGVAGEQKFSVDISDDLSIIFCANHSTLPMLDIGCVDWEKVHRIKILSIGDSYAK